MNLRDKKIGIWGFGLVGKAALEYFASKNCDIQILDKRKITHNEIMHVMKHIQSSTSLPTVVSEDRRKEFFTYNDLILASPGIDLRPYSKYKHKFVTELDILQKEFRKPIVAITGSVGKTTVTHALSHILTHLNSKDTPSQNNIPRV